MNKLKKIFTIKRTDKYSPQKSRPTSTSTFASISSTTSTNSTSSTTSSTSIFSDSINPFSDSNSRENYKLQRLERNGILGVGLPCTSSSSLEIHKMEKFGTKREERGSESERSNDKIVKGLVDREIGDDWVCW
ncbi:hypothetical protein NHQ30_004851 [Ciborinia camelliae]|nr:hypothetical protein NHQ30_004851 [Ciborinia camelliae]